LNKAAKVWTIVPDCYGSLCKGSPSALAFARIGAQLAASTIPARSVRHRMKQDDPSPHDITGLLWLSLLALIIGAYAGFVGGLFRFAIEHSAHLHAAIVTYAQTAGIWGILLVMGVFGAATALAGYLVRAYSPYASGSGIPHVESALRRELPQPPLSLVPIKFVGGLLAIWSGLALGREGPSVQMGATMAHHIGRIFGFSWPDCRALAASGAGAGLAAAFNSPIAGAVFVLEELVGRFELKMAIAALGASLAAISVSHLILPNVPVFDVAPIADPIPEVKPLCLILGLIAGFAGIAYNKILLGAMATLGHTKVEIRAGLTGAALGVLALYAPALIGDGEANAQVALAGTGTIGALSLIFLARFAVSIFSYAAGTPGGIFAPLLGLGAQLGLVFGLLCVMLFPDLDIEPRSFAIAGMAALFTAVVRAPVTGIVLVTEMTGNVTMLLPTLGACFIAMLVPSILRNPPIYDSLREASLKVQKEVHPSMRPRPKAVPSE
jgi:CIC family chloride channel protein